MIKGKNQLRCDVITIYLNGKIVIKKGDNLVLFKRKEKGKVEKQPEVNLVPVRTEQFAYYLLRLSLDEWFVTKKKNESLPTMSTYKLMQLLYYAEGLSFLEEDKWLSIEEPFFYDSRRGVALKSLHDKWKSYGLSECLLLKLAHDYKAEGYERKQALAPFLDEHLPIDSLSKSERKGLKAVWTVLHDSSEQHLVCMVKESLPYRLAKIRADGYPQAFTQMILPSEIQEDFTGKY